MKGRRELVFGEVSEDVADSARQLPLMVERGLQDLRATRADVSSIVVSRGPGSFTGIRVGLAYVYGLSFGLGGVSKSFPRVSGVSSLKVMAENLARQENVDVALCLPATKSGGYVALTSNGTATLASLDLALDGATKGWPERWVSIGNWELLTQSVGTTSGVKLTTLEAKRAAYDALLVIADLLSHDEGIAWSEVLPDAIYLRKSTVEEKAERQ
jgi:tRNA threonylcarbamoyl adenosine modification protein YeaZ